jgi:hypothetical protein
VERYGAGGPETEGNQDTKMEAAGDSEGDGGDDIKKVKGLRIRGLEVKGERLRGLNLSTQHSVLRTPA